jgi:hypothetical protein
MPFTGSAAVDEGAHHRQPPAQGHHLKLIAA